MPLITLYLKDAELRSQVSGILTSGMVGIEVKLVCDESWNGLRKTVVFRAGDIVKTVFVHNDRVVVPRQTLVAGKWLEIGVEGRNLNGTLVIPTQWDRCCIVLPGAVTEDTPEETPTQPTEPADENVHAQYFTITDDGVLSLKPEYRGACPTMRSSYSYAISDNGLNAAGSQNAELPKSLVIPMVVDEIAVARLADGMFLYNHAVEQITLPDSITEIPERFCDNAIGLKAIHNTEYVSSLGWAACQYTLLQKVQFPNLRSMADYALNACGFMVYADIGNVTAIPPNCFSGCMMLSRIKGGANVTTVGKNAFNLCYRLNSVEFLPNLTSIGDNAFLRCRLNFDWGSLPNCTFGNKATALQLNPTDIWSNCTVTAVENPVPTLLSQLDPRWEAKKIGTTNYTYGNGCVLFTAMHIYCALHGLKLSKIEDFEAIVHGIDPNILNDFYPSLTQAKSFCERLGLNVEYYSEYTQSSLQAVYDGLAAGKYAIAMFSARHGTTLGHAAMIYGINENGEWLIADSALTPAATVGKGEKTITYPMSYQNGTEPSLDVYIVSL